MANNSKKVQKKPIQPQKNNKSLIAIIAATAVVLLVAILCIIGFQKDKAKSTAQQETSSADAPATSQQDVGYRTTPVIDLKDELIYTAVIEVENYGTIRVQLDQKTAPVTTANFIDLAQKGFYNGLTFHRIKDGFMMQGGSPDGNSTGGPGYSIVGEFASNGFENKLSHTAGAISMGRTSVDKNSAGSQFFIVHEDSTFLDGDYAAFGYVTQGMDVVDAICTSAQPTDNNGTIPADKQPVMTSVTIETK